MAALFIRSLQPQQYEPARTAQQFVAWFTALRPSIGLWCLLGALPFLVFCLGFVTLLLTWRIDPDLRSAAARTLEAMRTHLPTLAVVFATIMAAVILAIVGLHVLSD